MGVIGGVPQMLGGGGLEHQIEMTLAALTRRGHDARHIWKIDAGDPPQLIHAFGSGADVWQQLVHWRRDSRPLLVSPVIVCSPGRSERALLLGSRIGQRIPNIYSMMRDVVRRADLVVALTEYEKWIARRLAPDADVRIVGNGVEPVRPAEDSPVPEGEPYVVILGTVDPRKRQAEALRGLGRRHRFVIVGGLSAEQDEAEFRELVETMDAVWLGEVSDASVVRRVLSDAKGLLLLSEAEVQSLAVLEALACATPVVASPLPSHRELAQRFPGWLMTADSLADADRALDSLDDATGKSPPSIQTWDDVALSIESLYGELLA